MGEGAPRANNQLDSSICFDRLVDAKVNAALLNNGSADSSTV